MDMGVSAAKRRDAADALQNSETLLGPCQRQGDMNGSDDPFDESGFVGIHESILADIPHQDRQYVSGYTI